MKSCENCIYFGKYWNEMSYCKKKNVGLCRKLGEPYKICKDYMVKENKL